MMSPKSLKGRKRAERAPTTSLALPFTISFQTFDLSEAFIEECHIAGLLPKRSSILLTKTLVKAISGSNTKDCFPCFNTSLMASK